MGESNWIGQLGWGELDIFGGKKYARLSLATESRQTRTRLHALLKPLRPVPDDVWFPENSIIIILNFPLVLNAVKGSCRRG